MALPEGVDEILPLTPAQTGMLFHVLEDPEAVGRYVAVLTCRLSGPLDVEKLRGSIVGAVTARDAYRAAFVWEGVKQPVQAIRSEISLPWELLDWSDLDAPDADRSLDELVTLERGRRFDLTRAPLMAVHLIRRSATEHILVWTIHHLISDGWSTSVVLRDVLDRYAGRTGQAQPPARFRDFVAWMRASGRSVADPGYWSDHLAGLDGPSRLDLAPVKHPIAAHVNHKGHLDAEATEELRACATSLRVTPHTVLSAAWAMTLRHLMGRDDVVFGQTTAGRPAEIPGIGQAAGAFINTLPLRVTCQGEDTVAELIARTGRLQRDRGPHEFASLAEVQVLAKVPPGSGLFDTVFASEAVPETEQTIGDISLTDLRTVQSSNYTLTMLVTPGKALTCELYADQSVILTPMAGVILDRYLAIVRAMIANPTQTIRSAISSAIPSDPVPALAHDPANVLDRILAQATKTPNAPAVSDGNVTWTYAELIAKARGIAAALRAAGVEQDELIPVALGRGAPCLAAYLGVWMTGAGYAPIDLTYPVARIAQILDIVAPSRILTDQRSVSSLGDIAATCVLTDGIGPAASDAVSSKAGQSAYAIFTSGSQGRPKGVLISHSALAHSTGVRDLVYGGSPGAYLILSSLAFDSSVPGLYWPLVHGGMAVIAPNRAEQDPASLSALIRTHNVATLLCLPSLAQALIEALPPQDLVSLKTVIAAGETLPPHLCALVRDAQPGARLFNEYGPTEATVWVTAFDVTDHKSGPVPIGAAVPGTRADICDRDGLSVPPGAVGEIVISGPTLADGYLSDPDQTRASFPDRAGTSERTYRTGDLGHADAAGVITLLGRADRQVKIRGHRVELGEIEAVARSALHAANAAALMLEDRIALGVETERLPKDVKSILAGHLPDAWIPSTIQAVPKFPRLPNGKTDLSALRYLLGAKVTDTDQDAQPVTDLERQLAKIFCDVLQVETVTRDGNFFDLGGDSLKSIAVYSMARKAGLGFAPTDLFEHPTVRGLATHVLAQAGRPVDHTKTKHMVFAHKDGDKDAVLLLHGTMSLFNTVTRGLGDRHPVALSFSNYLHGTKAALGKSVEDETEQALRDLSELRSSGPYVLCGYSAGAVVALEMAARLGDDVKDLILIDPPYQILGKEPDLIQTEAGRQHQTKTKDYWRRRKARHLFRAAILLATAPVFGRAEWHRLQLVKTSVVFSMARYRLPRYDAPVQVILTRGNPTLAPGLTMDTHLTNKTVTHLDMDHADLISSPEGALAISTRIVASAKQSKTGPNRG